jgi:PAS domain S-box-containing protein
MRPPSNARVAAWLDAGGRPATLIRALVIVVAAGAATLVAISLAPIARPLPGGAAYLTAVATVAAFWGLPAGLLAAAVTATAFPLAAVPPFDDLAIETLEGMAAVATYLTAAILTALIVEAARRRMGLRSLRTVLEAAGDPILVAGDDRRYLEANPPALELLGLSLAEVRRRRIDDISAPQIRDRIPGMWESFMREGTLRGAFALRRADGSVRNVEVSATANVLPGLHVSIMRDVTDRDRMEQELRRRAEWRAVIADLGLRALRGELQPLMEAVVASLPGALSVDHATVLELLPGGEELLLRAAFGQPAELIGRATIPAMRGSMAALTLSSLRPVVIDDVEQEQRVDPRQLREHGIRSAMSVLIDGRDGPWGVLGVHTRTPRRFSEEEVTFLQEVANKLATAIEHYRAEEELRERSEAIARLAAERQRIVAEALDAEDRTRQHISERLHDEALQALLAARQDLAQAARTGDAAHLQRARDGVQQAIRDLRGAVADLHPVFLEHGGLASAVRTMLEHQAERAGLELDLELDLRSAGRGTRDQLILSVVRELCLNCARHAEASALRVRLSQGEREVVLEVDDDGRGMDSLRPEAALREGHIGLASIAQRVEAVGGRFTLVSGPGEGTHVRATVPLDREPARA